MNQEKMKKREIIAMVTALLMVTASMGLALAIYIPPTPTPTFLEDPVLWVVPENITRYISSSPDPLLDETVVEDVPMGTEFSANVSVLHQEGSGQYPLPAENVYIRFFVYDAANIQNITIGTAKRIPFSLPVIDENTNSDPIAKDLYFEAVTWEGWRIGDGVEYLIGDINWSGGPSITGNFAPPYTTADFHPENAYYYVKVPFTIRFVNQPEDGFTLYVYAENNLTGADRAHTAFSHDAGYHHEIPEFATIALPVATIMGLFLFFSHRKRK